MPVTHEPAAVRVRSLPDGDLSSTTVPVLSLKWYTPRATLAGRYGVTTGAPLQ